MDAKELKKQVDKQNRRDLINDDYSIRLVVWALARQGFMLHAAAHAYYRLDYDIHKARDYARYLSGCETFPLDDTLSKKLHDKNYS